MRGTVSCAFAGLGADVFGNITRMDNLLDSFEDKLQNARSELAETQAQLENARAELALPFAREEELPEKTDDGPEEDVPEPPKARDYER